MSLNKEFKNAIDNYGERVKTIKKFTDAIRTRPGMYIGPIGNRGFLNMIREIFQNSIDQLVDKSSPCNWFSLYYNEQTKLVEVEDNGLGFPFDSIIRILTTAHTSKNFVKKKGEYASGMNGVGAKVVNALSKEFMVESYHYSGKAVRVNFKAGTPTTKNPVSIKNTKINGSYKQGSKISFIPDESIMGQIDLSYIRVKRLITQIMSLTPIGSRMDFSAVDINGNSYRETIVNTDGIITDLKRRMRHPINNIINIMNDNGDRSINCAFYFDSGDVDMGPNEDVDVTAFSNFCPTSKGTHIDGCIDGITRWFTIYMNSIYLANARNKVKVIKKDIETGLTLFIDANELEPQFTGQAKDELSNEYMASYAKDVIMKGLDEWSKQNPQDLNKLCKFFKDIAELRQKSESDKKKIITKYKANVLTGLPDNYIRPLGKKNIELIIVEGESAKGTAETGRDRMTQGIFPVRGKVANAFKTTKANFFNNKEVQGITKIILGKDYYSKFDVSDCKVSKVIFMADADVDGAHISALLLRMFVMYFPQMIEAGMVYKAIPPLYSVSKGKNKKYFTEQSDIVKYIQAKLLQNNTIGLSKSKIITGKDVTALLMNNVDYIYYMDAISKTYACNQLLLEMILNHYVDNNNKFVYSKLKKEISSKYRFMSVESANNILIVSGTTDRSIFLVLDDRLIHDCRYILDIIRSNNSRYYYINGEKKSIYELMNIYEKSAPNIERYKGLGEMDKHELAESTLYPGSDRTLVQYTLEDAKEQIQTIREYESDPSKILSLVGTVTREDLLD